MPEYWCAFGKYQHFGYDMTKLEQAGLLSTTKFNYCRSLQNSDEDDKPGLPRVNSSCSYLRTDRCWNASSASLYCCNMFVFSQVRSEATIPLWEWGKKEWMWAHLLAAPKQLAIRWVLRNYCIFPPDWSYSEITTENLGRKESSYITDISSVSCI